MNLISKKELEGVTYETYSSLKEENGVITHTAGFNCYYYNKVKGGYVIYIHPQMDEYLKVSNHPKEFLSISEKEIWPKLFYVIATIVMFLMFLFLSKPIILVVLAISLLVIRRQSNIYFAKKYAKILSSEERNLIIRDGKTFIREIRRYVIFSKPKQLSPDFYRHLLRECRKVEGLKMYED